MKKVVRLTESELTRLVKRIINETDEEWHTFRDLKNELSKYGFTKDTAMEKETGMSILLKGNDYDGIFIHCKPREGYWNWGVHQGGKTILNKKYQMNFKNYNNIGNEGTILYNKIMSDIKPYLNMKIRPMPNNR